MTPRSPGLILLAAFAAFAAGLAAVAVVILLGVRRLEVWINPQANEDQEQLVKKPARHARAK